MLQARFVVVCGPTKLWDPKTLSKMMMLVIMHNMIVEDEGDGVCHALDFQILSSFQSRF